MQEFKKGQSVYDTAGYEYYYNQKLENGHLVNKIVEVQCGYYTSCGPDFTTEYTEGEAIVLYEIFDMPPKQKKCDEIIALDSAIKALQEKELKTKKLILEENKKLANIKLDLENKIKEFPNHNLLLKILNNSLPKFYVTCSGVSENIYGVYTDIGNGNCVAVFKNNYGDYKSLKYEYGDNEMKDKLFNTLEDAEKYFINIIKQNERFLSYGLKYYTKAKELFEKYDEEVPEYIIKGIEKYKEKELEDKKSDLESSKKYAQQYLDRVKKLEEELGETNAKNI